MRIQLKYLSMIAGLLAGSMGACIAVAAVPGANSSISSDDVLDEVVVTGARLQKLRAAVIKAEDRVVARYNKLNKDDDLDIECITDTPSGTHLSRRYCLTRLQQRAEQKDAIAYFAWKNATYLDLANGIAELPNPATAPMREVQTRLLERSEDYQKNLIRLLQDHPELREAVMEHGEARRRYAAALRERAKDKAQPVK